MRQCEHSILFVLAVSQSGPTPKEVSSKMEPGTQGKNLYRPLQHVRAKYKNLDILMTLIYHVYLFAANKGYTNSLLIDNTKHAYFSSLDIEECITV